MFNVRLFSMRYALRERIIRLILLMTLTTMEIALTRTLQAYGWREECFALRVHVLVHLISQLDETFPASCGRWWWDGP